MPRVRPPGRERRSVFKKAQYSGLHTEISGRRYYDPRLGRWLGRDPKEEKAGLNLYGFVSNDSINGWDYLGMEGYWNCDGWADQAVTMDVFTVTETAIYEDDTTSTREHVYGGCEGNDDGSGGNDARNHPEEKTNDTNKEQLKKECDGLSGQINEGNNQALALWKRTAIQFAYKRPTFYRTPNFAGIAKYGGGSLIIGTVAIKAYENFGATVYNEFQQSSIMRDNVQAASDLYNQATQQDARVNQLQQQWKAKGCDNL